jgi:transposase InsO family protein
MARTVVSMRVISAVIAVAEGGVVNVSEVCRDAGVSRKTFYAYLARYRAGGIAGIEPRSRRPHRSPGQTPAEVEDAVVRLRKELVDAGLDHGATTIQWHLGRRSGSVVVPSVASVHRILVRRGVVVAQPHKRPKGSWRRFEAPAPNEWWQIDATDWVIETGVVKIFNIIDDHSRVAIRSRAVDSASGEQAWQTFSEGAETWGLPAGMLSDNGLCFSGKLRHVEVLFEARLRDVGVRPITGRPFHPQTTGKVERFQQTLKKWLRRQRLAADLTELQSQLDEFCRIYNHQRPHQGIGRVTPLSRWQNSPRAEPAPTALEHPTWPPRQAPHQITINQAGIARVSGLIIGVGVEWAGCAATVILDDTSATIFVNRQLVRYLKLDHTRRYQPSGRKRGGSQRPRLRS